jgi:hypothetical protein
MTTSVRGPIAMHKAVHYLGRSLPLVKWLR